MHASPTMSDVRDILIETTRQAKEAEVVMGMTFDEQVFAAAGAALQQAGVRCEAFRTDTGFGLHDVDSDGYLSLDNVTAAARDAGDDWRDVVSTWVQQYLEIRARRGKIPTVDEIHEQLRVRLVAREGAPAYAREFTPDLVIALALDLPTMVSTISDETLTELPLELDELFEIGQANTDREVIDSAEHVDDGVLALEGESWFVASRMTNFSTLLPHLGAAPNGVLFVPLTRSVVLASIVSSKDALGQAMTITATANAIMNSEGIELPGGILSPYTYYWAPDGTIERIAGVAMEIDGEIMQPIIPGPVFGQFALGE